MPVLIVAGFSFAFSGDIGKQFKFNDIKEKEIINVFNEFVRKYPLTEKEN